MAAESGMYVGADVGNSAITGQVAVSFPAHPQYNTSGSIDDNGGSQTLKVGYYIDNNNRANAFYQHFNVEDGSSSTYGIAYDYIFGDNTFKPFIGALAGYGNIKSSDNTGTMNLDGSFFGGQAGLNYAFGENFSVEAGYRYMKANMKDTMSGTISRVAYTADVKIDTVKNWFIGANYKF